MNFSVEYDGRDEFGHLCQAFEVMRQELVKSNQKMWNSIEERKRLNAAFAHDLRTPLTIMQGYTDLILGSLDNDSDTDSEIRSSVCEIAGQIKRLNAFTNTMGTLQRLEDYEPRPKNISSSELTEMVSETAGLLFPNGKVEINSELNEQEFRLDKEALAQICENILSNAARYAKEKIAVCLQQDQEYITISIEDDGKGFTKKDLANANLAYYRGEKGRDDNASHFGLGLYIGSLLSEKMGGNLTIANGTKGGAKIFIKVRSI